MTSHSTTTLQVMWNRLLAVVEEQGQALIRAAFSPIVRECGDISAGIFDLRGRMLAQAVTGTPGHINTMAEAVKFLVSRFPVEDMHPGDIYMTNDPWLASGHLNDFLLMMPAFRDGVVVGFTSCTSHLVDLGGKGMGPEGEDIFDEGLLIPPCKLVEAGTINPLLMEIVKANSREPIANEGDIYALISCCETGAERLVGMMSEFDLNDLAPLADYIIETSRRGTLAAIADVPPGIYESTLRVDGYEQAIELCAKLTVGADGITLDFDGTSGCSRYGINVPLNYATAYAVFAMRCVIGPEIPNNAGSLEPFRVIAPENCILNALSPAPVAMRHTLGQMTPDLVYGCLHQALPDRIPAEGASSMYDLPLRSAPEVAREGGEVFAIELTHNGGTGARPTKDGLSATAFPSGVWGSQVEISESVAPILIKRRELREDSGGAGRYRGGLGQRIEMTAANGEPYVLFLSVERVKYPARGRGGGLPGAPGRIRIEDQPDMPGKGQFRIEGDQTLVFETPGGGGFGPPSQRSRDAVRKDLEDGVISPASAELYGYVTEPKKMIAANPHIAALAPYALADLGAPGQRLVSLAQNESLRPPSPHAIAAAQAALKETALYPDPDWTDLRAAIAEVHGIDPAMILCGAGSMELIGALAAAYIGPDERALTTDYAYLFFRTATRLVNAEIDLVRETNLTVDTEALLSAVRPETKIVFVANPGNPTGTTVERAALVRLRENLREDILLVIDEAYGEFADQPGELMFGQVAFGNTVVVRTFSKAYGLAGLRVGWGMFPPAIAAEVRKVLNPNNVAATAQAAATEAMRDQRYMGETVDLTAALRDRFASRLREMNLTVPVSQTNFVLIRFASQTAAGAADAALRREGILMRGMAGYGLGDCLRATIGAEAAMDRAADVLKGLHGMEPQT